MAPRAVPRRSRAATNGHVVTGTWPRTVARPCIEQRKRDGVGQHPTSTLQGRTRVVGPNTFVDGTEGPDRSASDEGGREGERSPS